MSLFRTIGLRTIKKYPEVFSALEEFERTKRISKFTYRRRSDITLDEHILKKFKLFCRQKNIPFSRAIEELIKEKLAKEKLAR